MNTDEKDNEYDGIYQSTLNQMEELHEIINESQQRLSEHLEYFELTEKTNPEYPQQAQLTRIAKEVEFIRWGKELEKKLSKNLEDIVEYDRKITAMNESGTYSFTFPYFEEGLTGVFEQTEPVWSKMEGYELHSFLPVYRIDEEDHIDADELFSIIHNKKTNIVATAKESLMRLTLEDPLRALFAEAILSVEEDKYLAGQSLLANIYGLIREHRLKEQHFVPRNENHFLTKWGKLRDFVLRIASDYTEEDVKLTLMTLYVFANTSYFHEDHDPQYLPSRNGMTHMNSSYFSTYNCLCFLLYVSEVFDLIYRLESMPDSIVKPKIEWDA